MIDESKVVYLDTETTGLDPDRHEIWELALIVDDKEYEWQLDVDLRQADPGALRINNYYNRFSRLGGSKTQVAIPDTLAARLGTLTAGRMLVGAVPSFDAAFLERFMRRRGYCPAWHHRLICVETLAAGALKMMPQGLRQMAEPFGITFEAGERHTALGDARVARALYQAVMAESVSAAQ